MRVLVCGGRSYYDVRRVYDVLDGLAGVDCIIDGSAAGADTIAASWAVELGRENLRFPADWKRFGNRAGPIRNKRMITEGKPDLVIAFPGGKGTANMIKQAKEHGIEVREIEP